MEVQWVGRWEREENGTGSRSLLEVERQSVRRKVSGWSGQMNFAESFAVNSAQSRALTNLDTY